MSEFALIDAHFAQGWFQGPEVTLGVGDDGAVMDLAAIDLTPAGFPPSADIEVSNQVQSAVSSANLVATRPHTGTGMVINALTRAAYRVAMAGALPRWLTMGLTLQETSAPWLASTTKAMRETTSGWQLSLVGGDTTKGPPAVSLVAQGPRLRLIADSGTARAGYQRLVTSRHAHPAAICYLALHNRPLAFLQDGCWPAPLAPYMASATSTMRNRTCTSAASTGVVSLVNQDLVDHLSEHWPGQFEVHAYADGSTTTV